MSSLLRAGAVLIGFGTATGCSQELTPMQPSLDAASLSCSSPAPLHGTKTTALGYIVVYKEGTNVQEMTQQLAKKYNFTPRHVYQYALLGFSAELSDAALAGIRCQPVVDYVSHIVVGSIT
jgi:hypothetical protein